MRRFAAFLMAALFIIGLAPCAFASELLARPGEGQVIFLDADNDLEYSVDFPLCALEEAMRDGDDLILILPAAKLVLRGFFRPLGEWRGLSFKEGVHIGGADFDDEGRFTGQYSTVDEVQKQGSPLPAVAPELITARYTQYGIEILQGEHAVYGEVRDACMGQLAALSLVEKPDWQRVRSLFYEFALESDGALRPLRCYSQFNDGITVRCIKPQAVFLSGSLSLAPLSVGRASVSYENALGNVILALDVRCFVNESGQLQLSIPCDSCGGDQGGALHYCICGHHSCEENYDEAGHGIAECGIAGHCMSEAEHSRCKNCLEPVCNGQKHGYGQCTHVHNWMMMSIYTSRCVSCGYEYTSKPA